MRRRGQLEERASEIQKALEPYPFKAGVRYQQVLRDKGGMKREEVGDGKIDCEHPKVPSGRGLASMPTIDYITNPRCACRELCRCGA